MKLGFDRLNEVNIATGRASVARPSRIDQSMKLEYVN
jgi:hypothetical protein